LGEQNRSSDPESATVNGIKKSPFEDGLDERVPLVHPSAHPEQPHACGRYGNDDVGNGGVVLGEGAGGPTGEDEPNQDGTQYQIADGPTDNCRRNSHDD
jgi:hypothetical protein